MRIVSKGRQKSILLIGPVNTAALILELALVSLHNTVTFCLAASNSRGLDQMMGKMLFSSVYADTA